jgi:hypothetical protein
MAMATVNGLGFFKTSRSRPPFDSLPLQLSSLTQTNLPFSVQHLINRICPAVLQTKITYLILQHLSLQPSDSTQQSLLLLDRHAICTLTSPSKPHHVNRHDLLASKSNSTTPTPDNPIAQ